MLVECPIYNRRLQTIFYDYKTTQVGGSHYRAMAYIKKYQGRAFAHDFEYYPITFKISKKILCDNSINKTVLFAFIRFCSVYENRYGAFVLPFDNTPDFFMMEQWYKIYMLHTEGAPEITAEDFENLYKRLINSVGNYRYYEYQLCSEWATEYLEVTPALFAYLLRAGCKSLPLLWYELYRRRNIDGDVILYGNQLDKIMNANTDADQDLLDAAIIIARLRGLLTIVPDEDYIFYSVEDGEPKIEAPLYCYILLPLYKHPSRSWPDDTSFTAGDLQEDYRRAWDEPDNP